MVVGGGNVAQARNYGIRNSKGRIIVFTDSDCVAPSHWLRLIADDFKENDDIDGVGGVGLTPENSSIIGKAIDYIYSSYLGSLRSISIYSRIKHSKRLVSGLSCHNSAYIRNILKQVGYFDPEFSMNEDTNLMYKLREKNSKLLYDPDLYLWHKRKDSIFNFAKKFYRYGEGRIRSLLTNIKYFNIKRIFPLIVFPILIILSLYKPLLIWLFLSIYLLLIIFYGIKAVIKTRKLIYLFLVPILFLTQHSSYLVGCISGFVKGKWKIKSSNCYLVHYEIMEN